MDSGRRIYFPLASNAHSLVTGSAIESVRRRIKVASLLHDEVFLESGSMQIQAGATGAMAFRNSGTDTAARWQTPAHRASLQASEFTLSLGPKGTVAGSSEVREMMRSRSAIAWYPTFEPFRGELPVEATWISIGQFNAPTAEEKARGRSWRNRDASNNDLLERLPDALVRNQVLGSIENDLLTASLRGVGLSMDRLHSVVMSSRLDDPRVQVRGFAFPVLVPRAGALSWGDVADLRGHRSIVALRGVLLDIEGEVLEQVNTTGEIPNMVQQRYRDRLERYALDTPSVAGAIGLGIAEILVGGAIGFATAGLGWVGSLVGVAPGAALMSYDAFGRARVRRSRSWISALQAVQERTG